MKPRAILSLILSVILILGGIIPATAAQTGTVLDDYLIVHNAFDGTDATAQKSDTATGGSSKEVLTTLGTTANGVTTVSGTSTTLAYCAGSSTGNAIAKGEDIMGNTTGEFTFVFNFSLTATDASAVGSGYCDMFTFNSTKDIRVFTSNLNATTKTADLYFLTSANGGCTSAVKVGNIPISVEDEASKFVLFALTMSYDATAGTWDYIAYLSTDGGASYSTVKKENCAGTADFFKSTSTGNRWMKLGNVNVNRPNTSQSFDDFRIYNKALTVGELQYHLTSVEATAGAVCHGVQVSNFTSTDSSYALRFVGSIDSLTAYKEVGFEITVGDDYKWDFAAEEVYSSLIASGDMGMVEEYTAAKLRGDGSYLYAISLTEIPLKESNVNTTYTFTVKPYSIAFDSDERVYGQAYNFTFTAGVFQSAAKA